MQRENEPFLLRRRPAVVALTVERHGGEGEQVFVGEELGGVGDGESVIYVLEHKWNM
jgi:hypothetical protein